MSNTVASEEPLMHRAPDGTLTMEWFGPDQCLVSKDILEGMVSAHNKYLAVVWAAKLIEQNETADGDFDLYIQGQEDLITAVRAL